MKKIIGFVLFFAAPFLSKAQDWHVGLIGGISNYSGDLSEKRVDFRYTRPMVGLMLKKDINRYLTLRAGFSFGMIAAADSTNASIPLQARNLSFRSNLWEGQLGAEWNILDIDEKGFTPYIFGGVALFSFYPFAINDSSGAKVPLRRLSTEGQGLPQYPERGNQYALHQIAIPFGVGFKYLFTDRWTLGVEVGLRPTFTDYLDDVSTGYVDQNTLLAERGQQAVDYAYRGDEVSKLTPGTYPLDGAQRGSAKYNDWYTFSGITVMYRFGSRGEGGRRSTNFSRCFKM